MRVITWLLLGFFALAAQGCAVDRTTWSFDRPDILGSAAIHVEGSPRKIETPAGPAEQFDGAHDAVFVDAHPLAGAGQFTAQAVFRPDGGDFEQRWMHLAETDPKTGKDTGTRFLFEIRVVEDRWYLDAFTKGPGYNQTLAIPAKTFPVRRWYAVAMTFDGTMFRSYVDGVMQAEAPIDYKPQGPGHASLGTRINRADYFKGAMYQLQFLGRALPPQEQLKVPAGLNPQEKQD